MAYKNKTLIDKMNLEQKCALLSGKNTWESRDYKELGIPPIWMSDGPHGLRKQTGAADHLGLNGSEPSTCFPTAATVANSWDPELGEAVGETLGEEAAAMDVNVVLGPGLNMKRNPLCGRNFEYFTEDPYLAGKMAAGYIRGLQSQGGAACPKHFAVNDQELRRMASNSVVDERTLREIYLTGFEIAVKEGHPKSIMSSYNEINGTYANENEHLLMEILRNEWGFDGAVITDWGGSNDHTEGVRHGSNLEMPAPGLSSAMELVNAVKEGRLLEEDINDRVDELLTLILNVSENVEKAPKSFDKEKHHLIARKVASQSIVLLKNEENILPLSKDKKVAIIGDFAFTPRYQGAGSSLVNPTQLDTTINMAGNCGLSVIGAAEGYTRNGKADEAKKQAALDLAAKAEVVLFFVGLDEISESEGLDRTNMKLPHNQNELLIELSKINKNIVVILSAGSAVEMPWRKDVKAIVHGYLGGQAGAGAMLDVLAGRVNPSGKLAETIPDRYEDTPSYNYFPGDLRDVYYKEGLYIGYRYFDTVGKEVAFPFGYGLSYTSFEYSDLKITDTDVTFTITNTGDREGAEIAQLYIGKNDSGIFRPLKELKGFAKIKLDAGESKTVGISFNDKSFRYFDVSTNKWEIEGGTYQIMVGAAVNDIRLQGETLVKGTSDADPYAGKELSSYRSGKITDVSDSEFETLLGFKISKQQKGITRNSAFRDMNHGFSPIGWIVWLVLTAFYKISCKGEKPNLNVLFIYNMPFRALAKMTGGAFSRGMVDGLVLELRGGLIVGFVKLIIEAVKNAFASSAFAKKIKA